MLPRLRHVQVVTRSSRFNDFVKVSQRRWRSAEAAGATPELAHLRNPGTRPLLELTVGRLLEQAAETWPNRECVISIGQNQRLSYSELLRRADRLAAGLRRLGLEKGDRIGIWCPNHVEWLVGYMAGSRAGLIVAGINPAYQLGELDYCLRKIGTRAVIAPESYREQRYAQMLLAVKDKYPVLEHVIIQSEHHVAGTRRFKDVEALPSEKDLEAIRAEQDHISPYSGTNIQFTSGTTGKPKATLLSHHSLVNNARQAVTRLDTEGRKICLNVAYFHAFGMIMGAIGPLHVGSTVVLENPTFNPIKSIEAILRENCSVTFGTPTMWTNMMDVQNQTKVKIESLYTGSVGGAPISPSLFRRIRKSLRIEHIKSIYGMTEGTCISNQSLRDELQELTETTVGYISDHTEIKVVNENNETVPFGSPGELCIRGYNTMIKYWGDEEHTKKTLTDDKWLKTGDQYILRKDGYGLIVGRIKDMLIRGGENIFPKEVEHFLETHPAVSEAYVFGVYDEVYGEEICACIGTQAGVKLTKEDIVNYARGKIAKFKIPRYIEFCNDFPKTTSGKIQKFKLKHDLEERGIIPKKPID